MGRQNSIATGRVDTSYLDTLIAKGRYQSAIAAELGVSHGFVHEYIITTGQDEAYKAARELNKRKNTQRRKAIDRLRRKEKKRLQDDQALQDEETRYASENMAQEGVKAAITDLLRVLDNAIQKKASEKGSDIDLWALRTAISYKYDDPNPNRRPKLALESIYSVLKSHNLLMKQGDDIAIQAITKMSGVGYSNVINILKRLNLFVSLSQPKNYILAGNECIDHLIMSGNRLEDIAESFDVSREAVRQYISKTGQYEQWMVARSLVKHRTVFEYQRKQATVKSLVTILEKRMYGLASVSEPKYDPWALGMTLSYKRGCQPKDFEYPYEMVYGIFREYSIARQRNKMISLTKLAKKYGIYPAGVGRLFSRLGLKAQIKRVKPGIRRPSASQLGSVVNAYHTGINSNDAAYFSGVGIGRCQEIYRELDVDRLMKEEDPINRHFGKVDLRPFNLSYRMASQIYEAADLGFTDKEISSLYDKNLRVVIFALNCRPAIEKDLKYILDSMFNIKHDHPYRTSIKPRQ